jgi:hypothetical protein
MLLRFLVLLVLEVGFRLGVEGGLLVWAFSADPSTLVFAGTSSSDLDAPISANAHTKENFQDFSARIIEFIVKQHQTKPLYKMCPQLQTSRSTWPWLKS